MLSVEIEVGDVSRLVQTASEVGRGLERFDDRLPKFAQLLIGLVAIVSDLHLGGEVYDRSGNL